MTVGICQILLFFLSFCSLLFLGLLWQSSFTYVLLLVHVGRSSALILYTTPLFALIVSPFVWSQAQKLAPLTVALIRPMQCRLMWPWRCMPICLLSSSFSSSSSSSFSSSSSSFSSFSSSCCRCACVYGVCGVVHTYFSPATVSR